jgi:hypothetical protein
VRTGRLLEDMDLFAVWLAHKHILNPRQKEGMPTPHTLVTVLVDQISFTEIVPKVISIFDHFKFYLLRLIFAPIKDLNLYLF